jgi:hypothetical protein
MSDTYGGAPVSGWPGGPAGAGASLVYLRRAVRIRLGSPVTDDFFTDDVLTDTINLAINQIEEQQMWPWTEGLDYPVLTASNGTVTLPADWRATRNLAIGSPWNYELEARAPGDILRWPSNYAGIPRVYAEIGAGLQIRPLPDSAYTLNHHYYRQTPLLVNDTDSPLMPDRFSGAIVANTALLLAEREGNRQLAQLYQADVTNWMTLMRRATRRFTAPTVPRVRPGSWIDSWGFR